MDLQSSYLDGLFVTGCSICNQIVIFISIS